MNFISKLLSDTDCRNKRGNINMEIQTTEKRITKGLRFLEDNNVRFAVVKLISCNGAESNSFADARCGFEVLQDHNKVPSFLPFTVMFEKGVSILRRLENVNTVNNIDGIENLQDPIKEALVCLDKFYKTKGEVTKVVTPVSQSAWSVYVFYVKLILLWEVDRHSLRLSTTQKRICETTMNKPVIHFYQCMCISFFDIFAHDEKSMELFPYSIWFSLH